MKQLKAKMVLGAYRTMGLLARPFLTPYLGLRASRGKEDRNRRKERFGRPSKPRPQGPLVWLHAASVGETVALIPMIDYMLSAHINILLTTGTVTSASLVQSRFGSRIIHQYHPLDLSYAVARFVDYWKPDLAIACESEIWPLRIETLHARKIPQILVNAHLSGRSFSRWQKRPALAKFIFSKLNMAIGQNDADAKNYAALGVKTVAVAGNLKADVAPVGNALELDQYSQALGGRPVWAAVSTHQGEENIAAEVHLALKNHLPNLLTIIVPRHPERTDAIIEQLTGKGLVIARKSMGDYPKAETDILLGDTIGDMGLYLRLAKVAFIGKSLSDEGGHNPLEPALIGTAILSGPHVENFADAYAKLTACEGARIVDDATQLAVQVNLLLTQSGQREAMVAAARDAAAQMSGALQRTLHVLEPFLQPLIMTFQLNNEDAE